MINAGEKFPNIELKRPNSAGVVIASLGGELPKSIHGFMHSLSVPAGKRIGDKRTIEERIQDAVDGMMQKSIANAGFMDVPQLGVEDVETSVGTMTVNPIDQRFMER